MAKIVFDRSGDLHKAAFYRFNVPFEDIPAVQAPGRDWIMVQRTPTQDELHARGEETYAWIQMTSGSEHRVETKDCALAKEHVTHSYYKKVSGERMGGKQLSTFVPSDTDVIVLSDGLYQQMDRLKTGGARINSLNLVDHHTGKKVDGFWTLQFVGNAKLKLPKFVDIPNRCPYCGNSKIVCESCRDWSPYCKVCKKQMVIIASSHKGKSDLRIPFEEGIDAIEGKSWDGNDLVQARGWNFASKRFIDWLLRIHAAPFYAEPVYFCVDGMNDQQEKWFDDLQKPFEV